MSAPVPFIVQAFAPGSERKFCDTLDQAKKVAIELTAITGCPHHIFQVIGKVEIVPTPTFVAAG